MKIMGILNVTPDSFSDAGEYGGLEAAVNRAKQMVADGAHVIDVGGESTHPKAQAVPLEDELRRVIPVIKRLAQELKVPISIDTYKAEVARQAIQAGASIINDVTGGKRDPLMPAVMAETGAQVILMHNRLDGGQLPDYEDIVASVKEELAACIQVVEAAGVARDKIMIDPGIGFAKKIPDSTQLLKRIAELHDLGCPILLGTSRKGTVGALLGGLAVDHRLEGTMATTCFAVSKGIQMVRVHDVLENARAARVMGALMEEE